MFTGPNAGAPDPSITVTSRISSDPNGPACSGALALCALAFVAAIAAPTPNNTATTVFIVLLDLPRSLPGQQTRKANFMAWRSPAQIHTPRSEEHTSELQSHSDLVCRLLLEKKKEILLNTAKLKHIAILHFNDRSLYCDE